MGIFSTVKANKAYRLQQKGEKQEAIRLYEEAFQEGVNDPRYNLAYALLIIREGQYQKAKDFLVKHQKAPMSQEQRTTLLVDYAACCFRLGNLDKGIDVLEQQFRKTKTGLLYQTLGYLYVEKYDAANRPDFEAMKPAEQPEETDAAQPEETDAAQPEEEQPENPAPETALTEQPENPAEKPLTPEEAWEAGKKKAEEFVRSAVEYDDEDSVCLDNLGQFLYRVLGDRAGAKPWFEKALAIKDSQIDTLYFLSRYDLEAGNRAAALEKLQKAAEGRFSPLNYCGQDAIQKEIAALTGV